MSNPVGTRTELFLRSPVCTRNAVYDPPSISSPANYTRASQYSPANSIAAADVNPYSPINPPSHAEREAAEAARLEQLRVWEEEQKLPMVLQTNSMVATTNRISRSITTQQKRNCVAQYIQNTSNDHVDALYDALVQLENNIPPMNGTVGYNYVTGRPKEVLVNVSEFVKQCELPLNQQLNGIVATTFLYNLEAPYGELVRQPINLGHTPYKPFFVDIKVESLSRQKITVRIPLNNDPGNKGIVIKPHTYCVHPNEIIPRINEHQNLSLVKLDAYMMNATLEQLIGCYVIYQGTYLPLHNVHGKIWSITGDQVNIRLESQQLAYTYNIIADVKDLHIILQLVNNYDHPMLPEIRARKDF